MVEIALLGFIASETFMWGLMIHKVLLDIRTELRYPRNH
jgi:hypothetical protein